MRIIYVDAKPIRFEDGCGVRPLKKCPVQIYAQQHGIITTKNTPFPWNRTNIWVWVMSGDTSKKTLGNKELAAIIQNLCDSCYYGSAQKIKRCQNNTK